MGASFDIHLVRHGQSTWNAVRRIQGQTAHVPLTALGEQQARRAASQLADCGARAVFSSDLRRALQTALPIAERLGVAVTQEPDLRERSLGELEGRSSDQVWSATCDGWGDARWRPPGGESIRDMCTRVARFLDRLRTSPDGAPAVVVTHGDTARSHSACCTASLPTPCPTPLANGEVITVRVPLPEPRRMSSDDGRFTADRPPGFAGSLPSSSAPSGG